MTELFYRSHSEAWFKGKQVQALEELRTGMVRVPAGSILTICGKQRGLKLETTPCTKCKVSVYITRVAPHKVMLWEQP